jgi:hypothetical protein
LDNPPPVFIRQRPENRIYLGRIDKHCGMAKSQRVDFAKRLPALQFARASAARAWRVGENISADKR